MRSLKYFCACAALVLAACSKDKADLSRTMLALNLQSGGSVSSDTADDLYPQLVQPGNGTITLFFVSNRATASGCSATAYCIFVSQSVSVYTDGGTSLPNFTDPVALNVAGVAVTSTNAQGIAAFYDGTVPGYKVAYSDNTNAVKLAVLATANLSTGTLQGAPAAETGPSGARTGVVNGALNSGGMFYMLGDGGATQKKNQVATAGDAGAQTCAIADNCRWITYIRSAGANGLDFLHISTDGLLYRSSGGSSRAAESFNKTLAKGGLKLTGLSSLGHGNSDLLLVSGNTGGQNDLYVLNTPIKTAVTVAGAPPPVGVAGSGGGAALPNLVSANDYSLTSLKLKFASVATAANAECASAGACTPSKYSLTGGLTVNSVVSNCGAGVDCQYFTMSTSAQTASTSYTVTSVTSPAGSTTANFTGLDLTTSLVRHWKMNGNANDSSASAAHGTLNGGPTATAGVNGVASTAYAFAGNPQYMSAPALSLSSMSYTVTGWVKRAGNIGLRNAMFSIGTAATTSALMYVGFGSGNQVTCATFSNDTSGGTVVTDTTNWHFIACSYVNGTSRTVYLDGVADGSACAGPGCTGAFAGSTTNGLGRENFTPGDYFNGSIDEVRVYTTRALTATEIAGLYNLGVD